MAGDSITARMQDYFRRQMDLFERMAATGNPDPSDTDSPEWQKAQEQQARFARELEALEEEFWLLKREWDASPDIAPEARANMQDIAALALETAEKIARTNAQKALRVSEVMGEAQKQWATLQRGKRMLRNLRAGEQDDAGFIDRKV